MQAETAAKKVLVVGKEYFVSIVGLCLSYDSDRYTVAPLVAVGSDSLRGLIEREGPSSSAMIVDALMQIAAETARKSGFRKPIIEVAHDGPRHITQADRVVSREALIRDPDILRRTLDELCEQDPYNPEFPDQAIY